MSLINQALKKAQRERNDPPVAEPLVTPRKPGEVRPTHAETHKSYQFLTWMVGGGILITGVVAAVALAIVLMAPKPEAPEKAHEESVAVKISLPKPVTPPVATAPESPPAPVVQATPAPTAPVPTVPKPAPAPTVAEAAQTLAAPDPEPIQVPVLTPAPAPVPEPTPPVASSAPVVQQPAAVPVAQTPPPAPVVNPPAPVVATPAAPAPVAVATTQTLVPVPPAPTPEPVAQSQPPAPLVRDQPVAVAGDLAEPEPPPAPDAPLPGAEPNPKVLAFLQSSRITGIKVAGVHSRLLMNNQVYRMDDIVQPETQLRIKEIAANEILFVDESGIQYRKQFRR